jgi:hypothetical protein
MQLIKVEARRINQNAADLISDNGFCQSMYLQLHILKRNIMSTTPLYAAQVIIPKQHDNSITAAVAMITINQNTNKD